MFPAALEEISNLLRDSWPCHGTVSIELAVCKLTIKSENINLALKYDQFLFFSAFEDMLLLFVVYLVPRLNVILPELSQKYSRQALSSTNRCRCIRVCLHDGIMAMSCLLSAQARLETSWRALFVPARLKLDFLQKYCTLERILELPRIAHLLEIASKAVPLREKVRQVE